MSTAQREDAYRDLSREQLEARLKVAEDVCVLFGWTGARGDSERERAVSQMWMTWASMVGFEASDVTANRAINSMVPQLAAERSRIHSATLRRIAETGQ